MGLYDLRNRTTKFGQVRKWTGQDGRKYSDTHKGDDYAETRGNDPVYAIEPGVVVKSEYSSTFGHMLWVRRSDGLVIRYHMLNERSPLAVGAEVFEGVTLIGRTGASAANATGNHVHVQAEINGKPVDPRPFIEGAQIVDNIGGENLAGGSSTTFPEEDEMSAEDITWIKEKLQSIDNSIGDKRIGVLDRSNAAAASASQATSMLQTIINWIEDPNIGIVKQLGTLAGNDVRVADLVKQIQQTTAGHTPLVIPDGWLEQITEAARTGGADAVKSLEFVTTVK
jgi:hypothetical protein